MANSDSITIQRTIGCIKASTEKDLAEMLGSRYLNLHPRWQRIFALWPTEELTLFIETILRGRSMNPLWVIDNPEEDQEDMLDGMHRSCIAIMFMKNKFALKAQYSNYIKDNTLDKCYFKDLPKKLQNQIKNYQFSINILDESYHYDSTKRAHMYNILNRQPKSLNEQQYLNVIYSYFNQLIKQYVNDINKYIKLKNTNKGKIEEIITTILALSQKLPSKWGSMMALYKNYLKNTIGKTEDEVKIYMNENRTVLINKIKLILSIYENLEHNNIKHSQQTRGKDPMIIYGICFTGRLIYKLRDSSTLNRHIDSLIPIFLSEIVNSSLDEGGKNSAFQNNLIIKIDEIIDKEYDKSDPKNRRCFNLNEKRQKLDEQNNKCNLCGKYLKLNEAKGDHIIEWSKKGPTTFENLQILCDICHKKKTANKI